MTLNAFTLAVTENVPPMPLAVNWGAVAIPLALVRIGIGGEDANIPLAPLAPGAAVNVTATPAGGYRSRPLRSLEAGGESLASGVFCPSPAVLVRLAGTSAFCVTVTVCPNTVTCATRLLIEVFATNEKLMVPALLPVIVSHAGCWRPSPEFRQEGLGK